MQNISSGLHIDYVETMITYNTILVCVQQPQLWTLSFVGQCIMYSLFNRLLLLVLRLMTSSSDGELIVVEWRQEWRQYHICVAVRRPDVISGQHPWPCTQGRDLALKVVYVIIGTVGVLDNLFVLVVFIVFIKITDKVFRNTASDERVFKKNL